MTKIITWAVFFFRRLNTEGKRKVDQELLTTKEAAKFLGLSEAALRCQRSRGGGDNCLVPIPYIRLGAKAIRYCKSDLLRIIEKQRISGAES